MTFAQTMLGIEWIVASALLFVLSVILSILDIILLLLVFKWREELRVYYLVLICVAGSFVCGFIAEDRGFIERLVYLISNIRLWASYGPLFIIITLNTYLRERWRRARKRDPH